MSERKWKGLLDMAKVKHEREARIYQVGPWAKTGICIRINSSLYNTTYGKEPTKQLNPLHPWQLHSTLDKVHQGQ